MSEDGKLLPVKPMSSFERLDIIVSFDIDPSQLEKNYFAAQRQVHPDRFVGATKQEKIYSAQHSAAINDAYQTLKDPITRAQELLKLAGFVQPNIEHQTLDDPELLMEVIELREALLEIETANDLMNFKYKIEKSVDENLAAISLAFQTKNYAEASKLLNRLRYLNKLRLEANHKQVA